MAAQLMNRTHRKAAACALAAGALALFAAPALAAHAPAPGRTNRQARRAVGIPAPLPAGAAGAGLVVGGAIPPSRVTETHWYAGALGRRARPPMSLSADYLTWIEQEVTPANGTAYEYFGYGLAIDGNTAFVAFAPGGGVNVYAYANGTWSLTQTLTDPQPGDQFGIAMAIDGSEAVIGANTATVNGNTWQGAAYIYTESGGSWSQSAMLTASNGAASDLFGQAVAIDGGTALIAAPQVTVNGYSYAGAAYVFTGSGGSWTQQAELTASDAGTQYFFGHAVGLSSPSVAIIGSTGVPDNGLTGVGAAYEFTESNGSWSQTQEFTAGDPSSGMGFAYSLSVDGNTAIFGAGLANGPNATYQGAAYIFTNSAGTWTQAQKLTASNGQQLDFFGDSVALSGNSAVIGAWGAASYQGAAYMFTNSGGSWDQAQELFASDGAANDYMGYTPFAASDGVALVSAYGHTVNGNAYEGAAYFFGTADLGLSLNAPGSVGQGSDFIAQAIATNAASAASPAVAVTVAVPASATFVSASASQGSCSEASGVVTCNFGQLPGNGGSATANVTLQATGSPGSTIDNQAGVALAQPSVSAAAPTSISSCTAGYTEYDGTLAAGGSALEPGGTPYHAPAGSENGVLSAPQGFQLYLVFQSPRFGRHVYRAPGNALHHFGPSGWYAWIVRAGSTGGSFAFCLKHP